MGTWTLYAAGADVSLLAMLLNGVAMLARQTAFIWGFALLAAFWHVGSTTVRLATSGSGASINGLIWAMLPLMLATLLTSSQAQCTVQVQSVRNGTTTRVDHVPFIVVAVPVVGSLLSNEAGTLVRTALSSVNSSYDVISASGNGFLDPMRRLLAARSAIQRLNALDSEIKTVVGACLGGDSGVDYAAIHKLVLNAGNSGATTATSLDVNGTGVTAIGALLYQVAQVKDGVVPDLNPSSGTILSCAGAADQVKADIESALSSAEFARVVQGGVNGMDDPDPRADMSLTQLNSEYLGMRGWSTVAGNLAGGQTQANAEVMNMLFAETVTSALNCIKASDPERAACEAAMIQAVEIERANIQGAAAEVPALMYAGAFAKFILALVIGLGPIIVMLAMFAGMEAGKAGKTMAQVVLWPLLAVNVGAELVNAMIQQSFANFLATVSQQGYLSLATMNAVYRELSLQIGVGSNIMASLPVIMGTIFAFSEASALKGTESQGAAKGGESAAAAAPSATAAAPLTRQSTPISITQGVGFARVQAVGALDAVSQTGTFGTLARDTSRVMSETDSRQQQVTEGQTNQRDWMKAFQTGDYSKWGLSHSQGQSVRSQFERNMRSTHHSGVDESAHADKQNSNRTEAGGSVGVGVGAAGGFKLGASGSTGTSAADTKGRSTRGSDSIGADEASALSKTLSSEQTDRMTRDIGGDASNSMKRSQSVAQRYDRALSHSTGQSDDLREALKVGSSLVGAHAKMGSDEIAHQMGTNADYERFQLADGYFRDQDASTAKYNEIAARDMASGASDALVGDARAKQAAVRTRAAVLQFNDGSASEDERYSALRFLTRGALAMTHMGIAPAEPGEMQRRREAMALPMDRTGASEPAAPQSSTGQAPAAAAATPMVRHAPGGTRGGAKLAHGVGQSAAAKPAAASGQTKLPAQRELAFNHDANSNLDAGAVAQAVRSTQGRARGLLADAESSGLGQAGAGTVLRTAKGVVDAAVDTTRTSDERSQVRFGTAPAPKQVGPIPAGGEVDQSAWSEARPL